MLNILAESFMVATRQEPGVRLRAQARREGFRAEGWSGDRRADVTSAPITPRDDR